MCSFCQFKTYKQIILDLHVQPRRHLADALVPAENMICNILLSGHVLSQLRRKYVEYSSVLFRHDNCQIVYATAVSGARILRRKRVNRDITQFATKAGKCLKM